MLEKSAANMNYLWSQAHLNLTPKLHCIQEHSLNHMGQFNGIGDMLEDDVEHIRQIAAKIEGQVNQIQRWRLCKTARGYERQWKIQFCYLQIF